MKKIIILLFCVAAFVTSFAQYNGQQNTDDRYYRSDNRRGGQYVNSSYNNRYFDRDYNNGGHFTHGDIFSARDRDFQIEKINRDFIFQVKAIQSDCYLRHREKKAAIRSAEAERLRQIEIVNNRFSRNH